MCYEQRFFKSLAKRTAHEREEIDPATKRARPDVHPIRPDVQPQITPRKGVERELEELV